MIILTVRTDNPEAELGLYQDEHQIEYHTWHADRQLAETIHSRILDLLKSHDYTLQDVSAIAVYRGPGSFTGLRIGISAANALAYGLDIPIYGATGGDWIKKAITALKSGQNKQIVIPEYGSAPHITQPRK